MPLIVIESLHKKRKGRWGQGERRDKGHAGSHHNNKAALARHSENIQSEGSRCMHDVPCRSAGLPVRWSAGHLHQNHQESLLKILAPGLYPTPAHSDCWGRGPRTCMCSELPRWFLYTLTFENHTENHKTPPQWSMEQHLLARSWGGARRGDWRNFSTGVQWSIDIVATIAFEMGFIICTLTKHS